MDSRPSPFRKLKTWPRKLRRNLRQRGWFGLLRLIGGKLRRMLTRNRSGEDVDVEFDRRFNVDTSGVIDLGELNINSSQLEFGNRYQAINEAYFNEIMRCVPIRHEDAVFIDVGSGKGRALLLASRMPFKRIIGIELSSELSDVAVRNFNSFRCDQQLCTNLESHAVDATTYQIPSDPLVVFMNNPFEEPVMRPFLTNLCRHTAGRSQPFYLVYVNAILRDLVSEFGFRFLSDGLLDHTSFVVFGPPPVEAPRRSAPQHV